MKPDALRSMAVGFLTDTCTITTRGGAAVFDPNVGTYVTGAAGAAVYTGACRVSARAVGIDQLVTAGDVPVPLSNYLVRVPWSTTGVEVDDLVTVTASSDPGLVGATLRVTAVHGATDNATRHLSCEKVEPVGEYDEAGS